MTPRPLLRDLALLAFAAALGWWAHGSSTTVRADTAHAPDNLGFQFGGTGIEGSLTLYSPSEHRLFVYPAAAGNAHITCAYSLKIEGVGKPLERTNCAPGNLY